MAADARSLPIRVGVIAAAITIGLAVLLLVVNRLGRPAAPSAAITDERSADAALGASPDTPPPDETAPIATESVTLQLFLIDSANRRLVPRIQRLDAPLTLAAKAQLAIEAADRHAGLTAAPRNRSARSLVSTAGIAYVDFGANLPTSMRKGSLAEIHAVYGVVGTLTTSFPQIRAVQFLVDGSSVDTLTGHFDLAGPILPHRDWLY